MAAVSRTVHAPLLGSEFDDFLFAPIDEERNGMRLSVLSALARLEVDPWQEAAKLARIPGPSATERLASLIALLPKEPSMHRDPDTIAARLVTLLPHRANSIPPRSRPWTEAVKASHSRAAIYLMLMVVLLGTEWMAAGHQLSMRVDKADASVSGTISSPSAPISHR